MINSFTSFSWMQLVVGLALAALIALVAHLSKNLSRSGAAAAAVLGTLVFGLGGLPWSVLLMGFFLSSSLLSRMFASRKSGLNEKFSKGSQRDWGQVLANGGIAGVLVVLQAAFPQAGWLWMAGAGTLAAANADTWATELGVLSTSRPRLLTTGLRVEPGTSGAVSTVGTLAAAAGSFFIALLAVFAWPADLGGSSLAALPARLLTITAAGLLGSLLDSLFGATIQGIFFCPICQKETERHPLHTCGSQTHLLRGNRRINNEFVNAACTISGAVLAGLAGLMVPGLPSRVPALPTAIPASSLQLSSPSFENGADIPLEFTCSGADHSPDLTWTGTPFGTQSFALLVEDPDAPFGDFTHWVLYNLPAETSHLEAAVPLDERLPGAGTQGFNSFRSMGYRGPCPPAGKPHHYIFTLFALDLSPNLPAGLNAASLREQIQGHILGQSSLTGMYSR